MAFPCKPPAGFSRVKNILFFALAFLFLLPSCATRKKSTKRKPYVTLTEAEIKNKFASLLSIGAEQVSNYKLYSFVDEWMNVSYKNAGKDKRGVDCSGLTTLLMAAVYDKKAGGPSASIYNQCSPLEKSQLSEGDLVFFKIESDYISHVGVYLQNNKFIHATTQRGVIVSDLKEAYYTKYFFAGGRLK